MAQQVRHRNSRARGLVRLALFEGGLRHPTAEEVCAKISRSGAKASLGTVYRNLNLMASLGEISKLSLGDGRERFDFCAEPHAHFKCDRCGAIVDIPMRLQKIAALERLGFDVRAERVLISGLCPKCAKKISANKKTRKEIK